MIALLKEKDVVLKDKFLKLEKFKRIILNLQLQGDELNLIISKSVASALLKNSLYGDRIMVTRVGL